MKAEKKDRTQSLYDPTRKTVGAMYNDLHKKSPDRVQVGEVCTEVMKSLCNDINEAIAMKPFGDESFYIHIHEKKDWQMPDALRRIVRHMRYRPYPEDDTTVFWHNPRTAETRFCWCLPHHSEMYNILANENLFDHDLVEELKAWKRVDLYYFGFTKNDEGNWIANPNFKDKPLKCS